MTSRASGHRPYGGSFRYKNANIYPGQGLFQQEKLLREVLLTKDALERRLGLPVDLVDTGKASAFLALDILRGERVFYADPDLCDEFELYVMRHAGDLAPFERERRRLLLQP